MKMIYKVFLVIAILLVCLIAWSMFLGDGGVLELAWNGIAKPVNATWDALTGQGTVMPDWNTITGVSNLGDADDAVEVGTGGGGDLIHGHAQNGF